MEPLTLVTTDGLALEAELARAATERAAAVLCHPHPLHGGSMRSLVIGALFDALPAAGVSCLRFNFRGVEGSQGTHAHGVDEHHDVRAAIARVRAVVTGPIPLVLAGWSFGADVALTTRDAAIDAWLPIAPPLRFADDLGATGADPRRKHFVLAANDEFRAADAVAATVERWTATTVTVIAGASHFFVGRTDRVVAAALSLVDELVSPA